MDEPSPIPPKLPKSKRFSKKEIALFSVFGTILLLFLVHLFVTREIPPIDDSDLVLPSKDSKSDLKFRDLRLKESALQDIVKLAEMGREEAQIDGEFLVNSPAPELEALRALAALRDAEFKSLWDRGETEIAIKKAVSILKVGSNIQRADGSPIHQLVGLSVTARGQAKIVEIVQSQRLSSAQLQLLFDEVMSASFDSQGFQKTLVVDYSSQKMLMEELAAGRIDIDYLSQNGEKGPDPSKPNPLLFKKNNTIRLYAEAYRDMIEEAAMFPASAPNAAYNRAHRIRVNRPKTYFSGNPVGELIFSMTIPAIVGVQERNRKTRIQFDLLRIQIAAEHYRLESGNWPNHLESLVPEFIDSIPIDLMDGKLLRYNTEALRIYSV